MGRLRHGYDAPLWRSINEEVIDLFGNEDGILHRLDPSGSCGGTDPVWSEPSGVATYKKYKLPFIFQDLTTPIETGDQGYEQLYLVTIYISRVHMQKAGVFIDTTGDYVSPGDKFEMFTKGDRIFWDIIGVDREGFVNDSDSWTQYTLECKRTTKFEPEREL